MHHLREAATPLPPLALSFREGWPWLRRWPRWGAKASAGEVVRVVVYDKAWNVAYRRDRDAGRRRYIDAAPVQARLRSLLDTGVPLRTLGRVTGLSATTVSTIVDGTQQHVQRATAARVRHLTLTSLYASVSSGHVPRVGAARRVQALLALGWPHHELGAAGIANSAQIIGAPGELITVQRWRQVRDVYDALSMTRGPSPRTRARAARLGYAPPLAWDEDTLDDPNATPQHAGPALHGGQEMVDRVAVARACATPGQAATLTAAERRAVVAVMAASGASDARIADHLDVADRTILRWRSQDGVRAGHRRPSTGTGSGAQRVDGEGDWDAVEARSITTRTQDHHRVTPPPSSGRGGSTRAAR